MKKLILLTSVAILAVNMSESLAATSGCDCGSTENGGSASDCCWKLENGTLTIYPNPNRTSNNDVTMKDFGTVHFDTGGISGSWSDASWSSRDIYSVVVEKGISNIGNNAFNNLGNIASVDMPYVTSVGDWAFYMYSNAFSVVNMPNVTSVGEWAFYNSNYRADGLQYVELNPNLTEENIGYNAFSQSSRYGAYSKAPAMSNDTTYCTTTNERKICNRCKGNSGNTFFRIYVSATASGHSCVSSCASGYLEKNGLCVLENRGCGLGYLQKNNLCVSETEGCGSGYLAKESICVEPSACTGEYIVDSENGLCKKMPGCLNYADGACGGCERGFYKKEGGCVSSEEGCGSGYLEKDSVCISSANGCGAGYKQIENWCNKIRWTPAEAAQVLTDDNNNTVTITFRK